MMNNTFTIRKLLYTTALSLTITAMMPAIAEAAQHELNPNTVEGAKITVNDDNSSTAGEDFRITVGDDDIDDEGNPQNIVFQASNYGTGTTTVQNVDHIILNYNSDGGGTGAFSIKNADTTEFNINNAGNASFTNDLSIGGNLDMTSGSISNATTITANDTILTTGLLQGDTLSVSGTTIDTSGNTSVVGTLDVNSGGGNTELAVGTGTIGLTGTTTVSGTTNINASVNSNTNINTGTSTGITTIGNNSSTVSIQGGTNNIATGTASTTNIGTTGGANNITGTNTLLGTTYVNSTGTAATTIGNTTGVATMTGSAVNINTSNTASLTTTIGSTHASAGNVTMQAGATNHITVSTTSNTVLGTTNINATGGATTNIATTTAATTNIGVLDGTNVIKGTTSINASTNNNTTINTGSSTGSVTMGNQSNTANMLAGINNIGTGAYTTANTMGSTQAGTTSKIYGGNAYSEIVDGTATFGVNVTGADAGERTTGGMVQTTATTAAIRASNSGTLASNGSTGTLALGSGGGYMAYSTTQNTGVGSIGGIVDNKEYQNKINGNTYIDGNVYINGTLDYVSSNSANTTVIGEDEGTSKLQNAEQGTTGGTSIVMLGSTATQSVVDTKGQISTQTGVAAESTAALTLTNGIGNTHGVVITESQATMSGGTRSTSFTLNDNGATFSNAESGAPVQVHGVADGTSDYDAVNVRQVASGVASAAAMANIPGVDTNKRFSLGMGFGNYMHHSNVAFGAAVRITEDSVIKASLSPTSRGNNIGVGYSVSW